VHRGQHVERGDGRGDDPACERDDERAVNAARSAFDKPEWNQSRYEGAYAHDCRAETPPTCFDERYASIQVVRASVFVRTQDLHAVPNDEHGQKRTGDERQDAGRRAGESKQEERAEPRDRSAEQNRKRRDRRPEANRQHDGNEREPCSERPP